MNISKKEDKGKWIWETIQLYTLTHIKAQEQLVVRKKIDVNEHKKLSNITLRHKVKEQLNIVLFIVGMNIHL